MASKSIKGRFIPDGYRAYVFRAFVTSTCGYDSPLNEIYRVVLAPSIEHAFKYIRDFERSQGFDFSFSMIAHESFSVFEEMYSSDSLF